MQGLYLWTKLELLISFYMLQPLWGALAWALGKVRGKAGGCWLFQLGALAWALERWVSRVVGCMASCCSHWWMRWPGRWGRWVMGHVGAGCSKVGVPAGVQGTGGGAVGAGCSKLGAPAWVLGKDGW